MSWWPPQPYVTPPASDLTDEVWIDGKPIYRKSFLLGGWGTGIAGVPANSTPNVTVATLPVFSSLLSLSCITRPVAGFRYISPPMPSSSAMYGIAEPNYGQCTVLANRAINYQASAVSFGYSLTVVAEYTR